MTTERAVSGSSTTSIREQSARMEPGLPEREIVQAAFGPPSDELFRLMVANVVDYAMLLLDPTGNVRSWNIGAERINGYAPHEIIGRHFSVFYAAEGVQAGECTRKLECAAGDGRYEDEGWRIRSDGSRFWANVIITALRDESGALVGFAKIMHDVTERKRVEGERQARVATAQAKRIKEAVLATLGQETHEARIRSVLLVDDNDDVRMRLADVLRHHGYEVHTALNGPEALALLQTFEPDLAILDIGLPGMDGYELAIRAVQARPHRPIRLIAVSGQEPTTDIARRRAAGFERHLMKPVRTRQLLDAIASLEA